MNIYGARERASEGKCAFKDDADGKNSLRS